MRRVLHRVGRDIEAAKYSVSSERNLLKATVEAMPIGVLIMVPPGNVVLVNRRASELWNNSQLRSFEDFKGATRLRLDGTLYPPSEWPIARALRDGSITEGEEVIHRELSGKLRRISISAAPVRDEAQNIVAAVAAFYDITPLQDALHQQEILLDEVNHRVKNTMAQVQALALLSRGGINRR